MREQESRAKSLRWRQRRHQKHLRPEQLRDATQWSPRSAAREGSRGAHLLLRVHVGMSKKHDSCCRLSSSVLHVVRALPKDQDLRPAPVSFLSDLGGCTTH